MVFEAYDGLYCIQNCLEYIYSYHKLPVPGLSHGSHNKIIQEDDSYLWPSVYKCFIEDGYDYHDWLN